ncbi:MAG TPA: MFS transporter [Anaerohalosphaeraceae bacterium]|nr:MFS transporter [Anaerohalosphaeraceae bacterium]
MTKNIQDSPDLYSYADRDQRQRTMRLSVVEGMLAMVAIGLMQNFYVPYLNDMGGSKFAVGVGFGSYLLAGGFIQIWVPTILGWAKNYRTLVILGTALQALFLVPFALMIYLIPKHAVWCSIAAMLIAAAANGISAGAWADWMSYIVPRRMRGKYFSFRTSMMTLSQFLACVGAGLALDRTDNVIAVFTVLWFVCVATRWMATGVLFWHYEPQHIHHQPQKRISFTDFIGQMHTHSYGKFILAFSLIYFGAYFASPFFALHMLNDLKFSYLQYSCIQLIVPLTTVFSLGLWGRISDRLGNIMPMRLAATLILLLPACWLISGNFWYLLGLNAIAGLAWGGFQLLTFNYSIGELPSGQRLAYISYMNAIAALFYFAGSALGGWLGPMLPNITHFQLHSIFICSTLLRLPACLIFQSLTTDEPAGTKMTAMEKFFFQPRRFLQGRFSR